MELMSINLKHANGKIDQATLELLLVDETIGFLGFGVSGVIWLGAFLYSKQLVSAIWGSVPAGRCISLPGRGARTGRSTSNLSLS